MDCLVPELQYSVRVVVSGVLWGNIAQGLRGQGPRIIDSLTKALGRFASSIQPRVGAFECPWVATLGNVRVVHPGRSPIRQGNTTRAIHSLTPNQERVRPPCRTAASAAF